MKGKALLLLGGAVGYVLGTRDGRERYEQIKSQTQRLWADPKVQQARQQVQSKAQAQARDLASQVSHRGGGSPEQGGTPSEPGDLSSPHGGTTYG